MFQATDTNTDGASQVVNDLTTTATQSTNAVISSFDMLRLQFLEWAPRAAFAVVVLVVGFLVARLVRRLVITVAGRLGLHTAAESSGLLESMQRVGINQTVHEILGTIVFWLLMCVFLMASCNILGLEALTSAMQGVVDYIPKLLVATIVIVIGMLVASFVRGIVATSADRVGVAYAQQLADGCYWVLAGIVFFAACDQLDIKFDLLKHVILIACAGLALGIGLCIGLGGREVMGGILAGYYVRQRLQAGDHVKVAGFEGTIREIGPVATVIETEEEGMMKCHSIPNIKMLSEAIC
jgi:hypothetical protein